jgi:hypothetical protein
MYILLKNNICVGTHNLKLDVNSLEKDEQQIELTNFNGDLSNIFGKKYTDGKFTEPEKNKQKLQHEENLQNQQFLKDTDWKATRHRDQLAMGTETSLSEAEYKELLAQRQQARERIIAIEE